MKARAYKKRTHCIFKHGDRFFNRDGSERQIIIHSDGSIYLATMNGVTCFFSKKAKDVLSYMINNYYTNADGDGIRSNYGKDLNEG